MSEQEGQGPAVLPLGSLAGLAVSITALLVSMELTQLSQEP